MQDADTLVSVGVTAKRAKRSKGAVKTKRTANPLKSMGLRFLFVMRDQFRYMLKIGKIESWSGFELFQPYFLLTISRDREDTRDF